MKLLQFEKKNEYLKNGIVHSQYLKSKQWRQKVWYAKEKANHRCQFCNADESDTTLVGHHRTYENFGNEKIEDITILCNTCHNILHKGRNKSYSKHKVEPYLDKFEFWEGNLIEKSPFLGKYPSVFDHTCNFFEITKHIRYNQRVWRDRLWCKNDNTLEYLDTCPACLHNKIFRICMQIETEVISSGCDWYYTATNNKIFTRRRKGMHRTKQELPYIAFPQTNKDLIVFHKSPTLFEDYQPVPISRLELYDLIQRACSNVSDSVRIRRSRDFGGSWAKDTGVKKNIRTIKIAFIDPFILEQNDIVITNNSFDMELVKFYPILESGGFQIVDGFEAVKRLLRKNNIVFSSKVLLSNQ